MTSRTALANYHPPASYDGRAAGLGGTGVAFIEGVAAAAHNPANLGGVKTLEMAVMAAPVRCRNPFRRPGRALRHPDPRALRGRRVPPVAAIESRDIGVASYRYHPPSIRP
ncbi:MAG TPA: hypothetical protein VFH51_04710 [Myxococcota bacterium]|nr:hypothetical protein [Myxococcota bacterium]